MTMMNSGHSAIESLMNDNWNDYGVDDDGPLPESHSDNNVQIPHVEFDVNDERLQHLYNAVNPLDDDGNHGCELYCQTINIINQMLTQT